MANYTEGASNLMSMDNEIKKKKHRRKDVANMQFVDVCHASKNLREQPPSYFGS